MPITRPGGVNRNVNITVAISRAFPGGANVWPEAAAIEPSIRRPQNAASRVTTPTSMHSPTASSPIVMRLPKIFGWACAV